MSRRPSHWSLPVEVLAWLGLVLGLYAVGSAVAAGPPPEPHVSRGAFPSPEQITTYTAAICGAVVTLFNTGLLIWNKFRPRKPRPKKRKSHAETPQ